MTGDTIGYAATKGTTAEPFFVPMAWQPASLSYVAIKTDAGGNLVTTSGNPSIVPLSPATASVSTSSAQVVAANASRTGLVITNVGAANVYFGLGAAAINNGGIALLPGGTWVMDRYTFSTLVVNAICASSATLAIQEFN